MDILRLDSYEKINRALASSVKPLTFFGAPEVLDTFFNNKGFELWSLTDEDKTYVFVKKVDREIWSNELRLLFQIFPEKIISVLREALDPPFIAYNELPINPNRVNQVVTDEVVIDLEKYISLENSSIRKRYKQAQKYNSNIVFKDFKRISTEDLQLFWKEWVEQRSNRPFAADRTHNDANFFRLYQDDKYFGIAAYDGTKLVGYSIGLRFDDEKCISVFNKCLRGYRNLGLQLSYIKGEKAYELGFKFMAIGGINNDFKKQFLPIAIIKHFYGYEIFRKPDFKTKTPDGYTHRLFW